MSGRNTQAVIDHVNNATEVLPLSVPAQGGEPVEVQSGNSGASPQLEAQPLTLSSENDGLVDRAASEPQSHAHLNDSISSRKLRTSQSLILLETDLLQALPP